MDSKTERLGVLTVGLGAVSTTFIAGVYATLKGFGRPVGALSEMGALPVKDAHGKKVKLREALPLVELEKFVFGAWDIFPENAYEMAKKSKVLENDLLEKLKVPLKKIKPMPAVFDSNYVKYLDGENRKTGATKYEQALALRQDMREFKKKNKCDRLVLIWCASTEAYVELGPEHQTIEAFEQALKNNHPKISPSMIYTYAAIQEGVPYANGAPNISVEVPALQKLANEKGVPLAGSDFKTGQTLMKTVIAPGLKSRFLGIDGWFSTNILGNRDGEVLQDPESFKSKEVSKLSVLDQILEPEDNPDLYGNMDHKVRINYYKPRGDQKEGWDNIDIHGWLGYPMQIKVNFLCRDSILAAPIVLDLVQFLDVANRAGEKGLQKWLGFYWKSPAVDVGEEAVHALYQQESVLLKQLLTFSDYFHRKEKIRPSYVKREESATVSLH